MTVRSTSQGFPHFSDIVAEDALPTIGSLAREDGQTVLNYADSALEKLFADRNTLLADGGTLSWSSGSLTTTTTFKLHINATNGTTPVTKTITGTAFTFDADGKMLYVTLDNRTADSTLSGGNVVANSATLPDPTSTAQDVVLIAKRIGTQLYFRNGVIFDDGQTATMASSGGGSGSGEINVVENSNDATNWAGTGTATVVTTTTAGDLPLAGVSATAIKIAAGAAADYVRYRWTMPAALKQRKLKVEWYQRPASYTAGDFKVEVYKNTTSAYNPGDYTEFSLSTDSSGTSSIPNATGKYVTYFDGDDADYYELRIVRVAGSSTLNIANVIVGPGIQPQGAVVEAPRTYTPAFNNVTMNSPAHATYTRFGQWAYVEYEGTAAADATGQVVFDVGAIFSGAGIDTSIWAGTSRQVAGHAFASLGVNHYTLAPTWSGSGGSIIFRVDGTATTLDATNPAADGGFDSGDRLSLGLWIPISQWAGSGTTNLAQNDVEYLTNTNTSTGASDTTAFGYGPAGVNIVAVSSAGTTIKKRVRAQRPFGSGAGSPVLKVSSDGNLWVEANTIFPYLESGTEFYGMRIVAGGTATTDMDVEFGGDGARGDDPWSNYTSWKWAVVLEQPGVAVGFGVADTTSTGLVPSGAYNRTTTAWTLGASSGLGTSLGAYHNVYGSIRGFTTSGSEAFELTSATQIDINTNVYRDSAGLKAHTTQTGYSRLISNLPTSSGATAWQFQTNYQDAQTAGSALVTTNTRTIGLATAEGAWTLGPSTGAIVHNMAGSLNFSVGSGTGTPAYGLRRNGSNALEFFTNSTTAGQIDSSGNWTLGSAGNTHILNVSTSSSATTGANGAPPAQVAGYWTVNINGTNRKIPYYNV